MSFRTRTINQWLSEGIPERSWAQVVRELDPSESTARRWEREGIPERTLRRLEDDTPTESPVNYDNTFLDSLESDYEKAIDDDGTDRLADEWVPGEIYSLDYWEELAAEIDDDVDNEYAEFEEES